MSVGSMGRRRFVPVAESDTRRVMDTSDQSQVSGNLAEVTDRQLYALRKRLAAGVHDPALTLRGALHSDLRQCSNERCRCRSGELHGPYTYLAVYTEGRSRTIYVPAAAQGTTEAHLALTQRNEQLLAEISQINLELLRRRALE